MPALALPFITIIITITTPAINSTCIIDIINELSPATSVTVGLTSVSISSISLITLFTSVTYTTFLDLSFDKTTTILPDGTSLFCLIVTSDTFPAFKSVIKSLYL